MHLKKFLGFIVNGREVQTNPKKIWTIRNLEIPENIKQVQSLNEKVLRLKQIHFPSDGQVHSLLQSDRKKKTQFRVNRGVRGHIPSTSATSDNTSNLVKAGRSREVVCLSGDISKCNQCCVSSRRGSNPTTGLLYQQKIDKGWKKLPKIREAGLLSCCCSLEKAPSIFLGSPDHRLHRPTVTTNPDTSWNVW